MFAVNEPRRQITIIDVVVGCMILASGLLTQFLFIHLSAVRRFCAFLLGCTIPVILIKVFAEIVKLRRELPKCRHQRCRRGNYQRERESAVGIYYRCTCGDLYLLENGTKLDWIDETGVRRPYMRRRDRSAKWHEA
jgi:hypothetical protein